MTQLATPIKLKVWWVPQVPMEAFEVEVESVEQAVFLMDALGKYDLFQFEHRVKPDYSNAGGLVMFENGEWVDWFDDETCEDDPRAYIAGRRAIATAEAKS